MMEKASSSYKHMFFANVRRFYDTGEYADVTLNMTNEKMKANACVLAAGSSVFHEDIQASESVDGSMMIDIPKVLTPYAMAFVLEFIYTGQLSRFDELNQIQMKEILSAASHYKVVSLQKLLKKKIETFELPSRQMRKRKDNVRYTDYQLDEDLGSSTSATEKSSDQLEIEKKQAMLLEISKNLAEAGGETSSEKPQEQEQKEKEDSVKSEHDDDYSATVVIPKKPRRFVTEVIRTEKDDDKVRQKLKKLHKCIDCGVTYKTLVAVHNHKRWHADQGHICPDCPQAFQTKRALDKHSIKHQPKVKSQCGVCQRKFTNLYILKLHMKTHTGEESYECDVCGKKFPYSSSLKTHKLIHKATKDFMCSVCGKGFTQKVHAKEHELQHSGTKRFQCVECGQLFQHSSGLTRHISDIHNKDRNFTCDQCGKTFPRKSKLQEHQRIHTGEKPYICDICGMSYKANRSLRHHKKMVHQVYIPKYQIGISHRLNPSQQQSIRELQDQQSIATQVPQKSTFEKKSINELEFVNVETLSEDQSYTTMSTVAAGTDHEEAAQVSVIRDQSAAGISEINEGVGTEVNTAQMYAGISSMPGTVSNGQTTKQTFIVPLSATVADGQGSSVMVTYMVPQLQTIVNQAMNEADIPTGGHTEANTLPAAEIQQTDTENDP